MSKKNVTIKIGSDVEEAKKGINSISSQLNKFAKEVTKSQKPVMNLLNSFNTVGKAFSLAKSAISAVSGAINNTVDAYNKQATAEKQLEAAAKNNPYLSDYSVQQLKAYASELQSISTVGDEELLPMMSQLAAAGRTQAEIQDIMSAALDVSATGAMSLETAVKQLNATYSGSVGKLGQMNGAVKGLTTEQLKNGEAVKILKEQYSGISKSVTESTGSWNQFKNTLGDIKESLGSTFANLQNSAGKVLNNFFSTIVEKLQSAGKEADEFKKKLNIIATLENEEAGVAELEGAVSELEKQSKRIHNIEAVALGQGAKVKADIKKDANATLTEITNKRAEIQAKINDTIAEYNNLQLQIEQNASDFRFGKITEEVWKQTDELLKAEQVRVNGSVSLAKAELAQYDEANKGKIASSKAVIEQTGKESEALEKIYETEFLGSYAAVAEERKKIDEQLATAQEKLAKAQEEATKKAKTGAENDANEKALSIITKNNAELQKNIDSINQKYALMQSEGQEIDELAQKQEILSAKESAYLALISEDTTLVTQNNSVAKSRLDDIKNSYLEIAEAIEKKKDSEKDQEEIKNLTKETDALAKKAKEFVTEISSQSLSEQIEQDIAKFEEMKKHVNSSSEEWQALNDKVKELSALLDEVKQKEAELGTTEQTNSVQQWAQGFQQKLEIVTQFADKYSDIMNSITDLVTQNAENETTVKLAELDKQLENGVISEEEYAEAKEKIEKETAEKEYQAQMWAWGANLLNIQAQTALAIVKALAEGGPYAGPAMAALIGVLGGVQLATAIANKPTPPSFATGGVIGGFIGASSGGDNTYIHARNGEMILNAAQQKALWNSIGTSSSGNVSMNVKVINNAANEARANPKMTTEGLIVTIDKIVNSSMQQGKYTDSMQIAESQSNGVTLL